MERIASFCVDHTRLERGMYISRVDGDVVTYDIRMKKPNQGDYLANGALHTIEHLFATYARNSVYGPGVIYVGPMGCREMKDKRALIRAVKSPQGEVSLDFTGKKPGRGAYVCPNSECLKRARKSRALERALDTAIPESVYEEMEKEMANGG